MDDTVDDCDSYWWTRLLFIPMNDGRLTSYYLR